MHKNLLNSRVIWRVVSLHHMKLHLDPDIQVVTQAKLYAHVQSRKHEVTYLYQTLLGFPECLIERMEFGAILHKENPQVPVYQTRDVG